MNTTEIQGRPDSGVSPGHDPQPGAGERSPARRGAAWPIVAIREIVARLSDRNFLISTGFTLVLLIAVFVLQGFLAARAADSTTSVAVTSPEAAQIVSSVQASPVPGLSSGNVAPVTVADEAAARAALTDGRADAWLHEEGDTWTLSATDTPGGQLSATLGTAVREHVLAANAQAAGTSMGALTQGATMQVQALTPQGDGADAADDLVRQLSGLVFAMLFYMASLLFGMAIASSVVEEKQSRIVEILATAIPVRQLLIGKVLGNTVLALGQMVLFVGVGLIGLSYTDYSAMLPSILGPAAWFLVFFLVGFVALACVWAVCGALASRNEDLQATTTPMSMLLVGILFLGIMASGTVQVVASYVPLASVITMPGRLLAGTAAWWEPIVSLGITVVFAALMIAVAERLYRRSLLQTGGRLSLRQALKVQE